MNYMELGTRLSTKDHAFSAVVGIGSILTPTPTFFPLSLRQVKALSILASRGVRDGAIQRNKNN
jgi:hypothetical protein